MLLALFKPYGVLSQFTPEPGSKWRTLADFKLPKAVYPIGRLDADSEGLLLLSDEKSVVDRLLNPTHAHPREYWVQVEGTPDEATLRRLKAGVRIGDYDTLPCRAQRLAEPPAIPERQPPIRVRKAIADTWISMELVEGKNRQVRRMTAAVGHPTLRLVRARIGGLKLVDTLTKPGDWKELTTAQRAEALGSG